MRLLTLLLLCPRAAALQGVKWHVAKGPGGTAGFKNEDGDDTDA
jgi:hypothetical protein